MKYTSTPRMLKNFLRFLSLGIILVITLFNTRSYAQTKNYATITPFPEVLNYSSLDLNTPHVDPNGGSVTNPGNAAIAPPVSPTLLTANFNSVLGLLGNEGSASIQLKYGAPVAAGTTTYIRFDQPYYTGVTLDLLSIVGDLTGLFSKKLVQVDAFTGATSSAAGTQIASANVTANIVKDASGQTYFAVTSTSAYNSVRVTLRQRNTLLALNLFGSINMNVYTAFNYSPDNCAGAIATDIGQSTGLNVSLTSLVTNPERAIDGNLATYSQLQAGLVSLGSSVSQTIYLNGLSAPGDVAKVVFSQPGSLLSVNVLKTITIQAYNGTTPIGTPASLSNLISLQLLGLFTNNSQIPVFFTPAAPFDRIKISIDNGLAVGGNILSGGLNINEVQRTVPKPTFNGITAGALTLCGGSTLTLNPLNPNAAYTYNFYKKTGTNGAVTQVTGVTGSTLTQTGLTAGVYTYYVAAVKTGCIAESDRDSVVVTVNPTLVFTATTLNNGTVGSAYSKQISPATGGTPTYTYTLAAGTALPAGLTISSSGLITGNPTVAGTVNFGLVATDISGCMTTANYTLKITGTLTLATATLPNGTVAKVYPSTQLPVPTGGSTPYTYAATNLPPGIVLNPNTGLLTGTPTTSGTYTFPVTITDADGNTVTTNFTITVRSPLVLSAATLSNGTTGVAYPTQIIPPATGGSGVNTYSATNLPPGLSFDPVTRAITGTPTTAGTYTFPVTVSDNEGNTNTLNYTIVVKDPLSLATATLPDGTVNVVYPTQTLPAATGGTGPYTYAATNLPPGLTFDPVTRQISGTPTTSGTFTIMVNVTDAANGTIAVPYTLKVGGALNLPGATLAGGKVGTTYTPQTLPAVTGGTAPYTYSVTGLPAGLTFDPATRTISGTPTVGGTFNVTMKASDSGSLSTSTDYTLNVTIDPPAVSTMTICSGNTATLTVQNPLTGVTYNFYSSTGSTPIGSGTAFTTPALTVTTTYYVEAVSGTAVSTRVPVTVTVNPTPDLPTVLTNNVTVTAGQTATLQATATSGSTINWYAAATGGIPLATGGNFTTPVLNANVTYYVGTSNSSNCSSPTRVPVIITVINGTVNPNCYAATKQESGITGGLLCIACAINNPGNSTDADLTNFTQISLPVGLGTTGYQRLIFRAPGVATDSISVDLETPTGLLDLTALGGITVSVMNGSTVVSSYPLSNSLINLRLLSGNRFTATVAAGGVYDRVEVKLSGLLTALTSVNIYGASVIAPGPTFSSGNQTICSGSTASLAATPVNGTALTWYSAATGGTILANGNTYTTPALTATTVYYVEVSKNGCANPSRIPVTVTVTTGLTTPVITPPSPVCSGSTATLSIANPVTGTTYNWYTVATGGTSVFTGTTFTTPALTTNTTYYAEAANGTCVSSARGTAAITVNALPLLPQITASATTVSQGQSVSLTGSSTESNVTFNWYTSANAVTPVFTGVTYITPPLTATTTFYLDATSTVTGCASSARVQQTITVNPAGTPIPVGCEGPVSETHGIGGGISLLSRVDNPALAIDNDQLTGSTLSVPVGLLGAYVYQQAHFAGLSNVGDTVRVLLTSPGQLLSLSLLPSVTITTYQGTTSNNDGVVVTNPLLNLQLLNGGSQALLTFVPAAQFDAVEVKLNAGLVGALASVNFNYARRTALAPVVASANVTACLNATATLSVPVPQPGIIYKWYDAAGTYLGNDGSTFTTPAITANTTFYVEASRGGCGSSRTAINVTLVPAPLVPVLLSPTQTTCAGSAITLQVQSPQPLVTYKWFNNGVEIIGATTSALTVPSVLVNSTYAVEAINSCGITSAQATVAVTVGALTPPVLTPAAVTINSGETAVLVANSSTSNLTFNWYTVDPGTNPGAIPIYTSTSGIFVTPALTATTTYYVTATSNVVGGCQSVAASVVVTVNTVTPNPGSVPCEGAVTQTNAVGGVLPVLAGVTNPDFAVDNDANTSSSLFIPVGVGGFVTQRVAFTGISTPGDQVKLSLTSTGALLTLAVAPSITVTTYNNGVSNNDEMPITNPLISLNLLTGNTGAFVQFTPTKPFDAVELKLNSGLLGLLTSINFNYAQRIVAPPTVASSAVTACLGGSASLAVNNPATGITYTWYDGSGAVVASNTATFATPTTLTAGTYTYSVAAIRGACPSVKTPVTVTITGSAPAPVPATGNPVTTCLNTPVTLSVNQVAGVTYNWYNALTAGSLLASNTSTYTTPANLPVGETDFYVEAVNGNSCVSTFARTKIAITINAPATAGDIAVAGAGNAFCSGTNAVLTASSITVTNPVFTWYSDAALTDVVATGPTFTIPSVTATTNYYVTVKGDNRCVNEAGTAKQVTLTVNPPASASDITVSGVPASLCSGTSVTLTASSTTVTNPVFTWYSDAALTHVVSNTAQFITPSTTTTTLYYVTVQGSNKCPNPASDAKVITLTVNPPANQSDISINGIPASVCYGSGVSLSASSLTVTNPVFTWFSDPGLSTAIFTGANFTTPVLNANTTYYVTVQGLNKCPNVVGTASVIALNVNTQLTFNGTALAPASTLSSYGVQISPATGGTPGYTYDVATGSTLPAGLSLSQTGLISGTPAAVGNFTFSINATDSKGCTATGLFTLVVSNTAVLALPPATLPDGVVGSAYALQTLPSATGGTTPYTYTATGLPPGLTFDPVTRNITGTPTLAGPFTIRVTVTDANNLTASANYPVNVTVPAPVVAGGSSCGGTSVTLTVSNPVTGVTYNWYANASGGASIFTGTSFQTPPVTANTTYYVEGASGTVTSTRVAAAVTLKSPATAADVSVTGIPAVVCGGSGVSLTASSTTVTNPTFIWYNDAALTSVAFTGPVFNTQPLTVNTTYYVTVQGPNTCESSAATAFAAVLNVNPALVFNGAALTPASTLSPYNEQLSSPTGGTPGYTYSLATGSNLPAGLTISPTGLISGTPAATGNFTFSVIVTDSKGCSATGQFTLIVGNSAVISLPPATLPDGVVGSVYPVQTLPAATGGTTPYTYTATGLPPGLTFDPVTRNITGTPTLAGPFTVTVTVTDANNLTASANYPINVTVPAPVVAGGSSCGGGRVTLTVSNPITAVTYNWYANATGGTPIFTGASFQTPAVTANTTYYVEGASGTVTSTRVAVNVTLKTAATSADVSVTGVPSVVCGGSGVSLTASSTTVTNPVFTWYNDAALTSVAFTGPVFVTQPLTVNTTYYVTVQGPNTCESSAATAFAAVLKVNPALIFNGATLTGATTATAYFAQVGSATGGTPGYTYSVASGSTLPAGLTLSAAGTLTGMPTATGNYTFSVMATDSKGCTATAVFTLTVGNTGQMTLPPATLPNGQVGAVYAPQTLPAPVGGAAPYTYVATNLPPGLTFDPTTRTISGTPTLGGSFTVTVSVTDSNGLTAAADYVIVVTVPASTVGNAVSCGGSSVTLTVTNVLSGVTYNWYAAATGGTILFTGPSFQTPAITANTTYYVEAVSGTATSGRIAANVTVATTLATPVVTVKSSTLTSITFGWNDITGATSYEVSIDGGTTWTSPSSGPAGTTHLISGLQTNTSVKLMVRAKGLTTCQTSTAGSVTGTANNGGLTTNDVFIPNTFTPNGDGKNDVFYVYGNAVAKVRMRIYNQWGQFVFQSLQQQVGWDGTFQGQIQPNGVYVYYIELVLTDGSTLNKKGTVTILR
ncbi:putative Ig domain-containing protein [Pedobacter cryoconitis]|uniref:Gliding motility-associated-like protein n=1 Tax=Pedobacter cryoconitis TaxID=188932 RepID=A0A7X0J677_9SPHI|nr:putative Ig domain-containing protein [Pedobacter cryoconitis]MBB6501399.1 gliding motility-associated-like protein [Pedobacter cryoconitis]